jgi:hypothetical protein
MAMKGGGGLLLVKCSMIATLGYTITKSCLKSIFLKKLSFFNLNNFF